MKLYTAFQSRLPSSRYIFTDGTVATFMSGEFLTDVPSQIFELQEEIKKNHPYIFIDENRKEVDINADPLAALKEELRAQILKDLELPKKNLGETEHKPILTPANSETIAPVTVSSGALGARLANISTKK